jgi:hypothetical protein
VKFPGNYSVNEVSTAITRSIVAVGIVAATVAMLLNGTAIPEAWWPTVVAVISYLFRNGNSTYKQ